GFPEIPDRRLARRNPPAAVNSWRFSGFLIQRKIDIVDILCGLQEPPVVSFRIDEKVFPQDFSGLEIDFPDFLRESERHQDPAGFSEIGVAGRAGIESAGQRYRGARENSR